MNQRINCSFITKYTCEFSKLTKFLDVKKIFKSVKLIANVPKSGMTVNNNKLKDGVKTNTQHDQDDSNIW